MSSNRLGRNPFEKKKTPAKKKKAPLTASVVEAETLDLAAATAAPAVTDPAPATPAASRPSIARPARPPLPRWAEPLAELASRAFLVRLKLQLLARAALQAQPGNRS